MSKPQSYVYREIAQGFSPLNSEKSFSRIQSDAFERFKELGFPTRKHEAWKYIYLDSILNTAYISSDESGIKCDPKKIPSSVVVSSLASGYEKLSEHYQSWLRNRLSVEDNAFALVNAFSFTEGLLAIIPKQTVLNQPLDLSILVSKIPSKPFVFYPRLVVILEDDAKAEILLDHKTFSRQAYFMNAAVDIYLGKNSSLRLSLLQREIENATSFIKVSAELCEKSRFEMISFTEGGLISRQETQVDFRGIQASCDLKNLSLLDGASRFYQHATANHWVPECQSNQLFKTILSEEAQSEVNSLVHVVRDAQKSESKQLNRNLLLSNQARIYSRPQLKIYADDVKCSHGAATGQLDESELFYLRSRGISKEKARFMMTLAFAEEVIQLIQPESLRKEIESRVTQTLEKIVC